MNYKPSVIWRESHEKAIRKWVKRVIVINLIYLAIIGVGVEKWLMMNHKDVQIEKLTGQNDEYRVKYEILNVLKLKGLSLGQGMDIADILITQSKELDIPIQLCLAVIKKESEFYTNAVSSAGAMGLMQLMPSTFDSYNKALKLGVGRQAAFDPIINVKIATHYLKDLIAEHKPKAKSESELWKKVLNEYSGGAKGYADHVKKMEKEYNSKLTPAILDIDGRAKR